MFAMGTRLNYLERYQLDNLKEVIMHLTASFIVSFDFSDKGGSVCIVGQQEKGKMNIVNAFQGEEAVEIFKKLSTPNKKEKEND